VHQRVLHQPDLVKGLTLALLLAGCASAPTSVLVRVSNGDTGPSPTSLQVDVFDASGRIADAALAAPSLPGTVIVRGLPDTAEELRVVVRGGALLGGERIETIAHQQVEVDVVLHASRPDTDGDGVPDDLDDCPTLADPLQGMTSCGSDGGVDSGVVPSNCPTNVAFCDGFEAATLAGHWSNNDQRGPSSWSIDSSRAYRGSRSLKIHHDPVDAGAVVAAAVGEGQSFPMSDFYVRAFMYVPSPLPAANEAVLFAIESQAPYSQVSMELNTQAKVNTYNNVATPVVYKASATAMPLDRWVCVEWEVLATASGSTRLWLDGTEVTDLEATQNLAASPAIDVLQIGMGVYQPSMALPAHDIWYDVVIVDGARVGCNK
jgi:hypothetical protein